MTGYSMDNWKVSGSEYDPFVAATIMPDGLADALGILNKLSKSRAEIYPEWLKVGKALYSFGDDGLLLWDTWSKNSTKYQPGLCAQTWKTFNPEIITAEGITLNDLIAWVQIDRNSPTIPPCPKNAKPSDYKEAIKAYGYKLSLNSMNDEIFVDGVRFTDPIEAKIINSLREYGYKSREIINDCILEIALENQFHPIREYLESLSWDGTDHITKLGSYFQDKDDIFTVLFRKWLIGAVGRILKPFDAIQNPVLVLDGIQGLGKSQFTYWLASPLPAYYMQSAINAGDKDSLIRACSVFVWELGELGATFRRSDIESLKAFITIPMVTVRAPYGRRDMHKPPTASFIGTINNVAGFLADPTGHRRFRPCTLTAIDWNYSKDVNINALWAQAVALFKNGETMDLDNATQLKINSINQKYEVDDPIAFTIFQKFNIDPQNKIQYTATAEIIKELRASGDIVGGDDRQIGQRIAAVLVKAGCENGRVRIRGQQVRAWYGVWK